MGGEVLLLTFKMFELTTMVRCSWLVVSVGWWEDVCMLVITKVLNDLKVNVRDAIIKENPVKSGFLQIGGSGGSRGPPDPDFLHVNKNSRF